MDAKELLLTRRSVRSFSDEPVDGKKLREALDIATYAPTAMGRQSPLLVCITDANVIDKLKELNSTVLGTTIDPYYGAKAVVIAFGQTERVTCVEDATSVLIYLELALHAVGLGSCWVHRVRQMFELPEGRALPTSWELPEGYVAVGSLAVGVPEGEAPHAAERKEDYVIYP
jgi:nitroreductase